LTIVHGDYRLDNLLFGGRDGAVPVAVVDWQTVATGPAMSDVAYFIGAGLLPGDRRAHEEALVRDHLDRLRAAGVEGYGWDAGWEDYRRGTWSGLIMAVAASMLVERTERGDEMFLTMARRHARHALDLDAAALLGT
jgi:aminoglycoside phosphotransferase (APT) family kinase protein